MQFLEPHEYQSLTQAVYEQIAARLRPALPEATIEHIGSSSVPGVRSKGDLDIFVAVAPTAFDKAVKTLIEVGCTIKQGSLRTESLCPFEMFGYAVDVGVQLVASNSKFEFFRTFRDCLLADENLRTEYNALKLSARGLSPQDYRVRKSQFIEAYLSAKIESYG